MNKKGFTLVELLTVVIILSLLGILVGTSVTKLVKDSREKLSNIQLMSIEESAKVWSVENVTILPNNGQCIYMTLGDLKGYGLIDEDVIDVKTSEKLSNEIFIKIIGESSKYNKLIHDYEITDDEENIKDCNKFRINYLDSDNVTPATAVTKTTGIVPNVDTNGDFLPGSEFKIKVSDEIGELTFFVLSNDEDYVNLIAQMNLAPDGTLSPENQTGDEWYVTASNTYDNRYGPQTAYNYLSSATSKWTNVPIIESFTYSDIEDQPEGITHTYGYESIVTKLNNKTGNYVTTINPLSSDYGNTITYANMRVRLPYVEEIIENTSCKIHSSSSDRGSCPIWMVNYLYSSSYYSTSEGKINSAGSNMGYWTLSFYPGNSNNARYVHFNGVITSNDTTYADHGIRPVITVLKEDLLKSMN